MPTLYDRRILNNPEVHLGFNDPLIGIIQPNEITLELENDGYFDARDVRGERITYNRFDKFSQENLAELTGVVTEQTLYIDRVVIRTVTHDLDDFQTLLPKELITAATFADAHPTLGLGKPIPIIFGIAGSTNKISDAWEMAYVGENTGSSFYDYLVGRGTFTNITVYRDSVGDTRYIVNPSEYTVNASAYPGFTVVRFALRQRNFNGGMHRLFVAADSVENGRNFARAIERLLSNSTWGLGLSTLGSSFTTAASALDTVGSLYCDGVIAEQRPALEWINQLVQVRGMQLDKENTGAWTLSVDGPQSTVYGKFGHGQGQQWANVNTFRGVQRTPVSQAVKSLILEYRRDRFTDIYALATTARSILSIGKELRLQHDFIRDRTTADKVADYIGKRHLYGDERLSFTAGQEARRLRPGQLIQYESMQPAFNKMFFVMNLARTLDTTDLEVVGWDSEIFTYTPQTLPAEPAATIADVDFSRSVPTAPTFLFVASSGVESDGQNGFAAFVVLQYTIADEAWAQTIVRVRRNGATNWETVAVDQATGVGLQTKITGLITGLSYDYQVSRVNLINTALIANTTMYTQVAPTDTSGPAAPTSLTMGDKQLKTIMPKWTAPADKDVKHYHFEIRDAASGGGTLLVEGDTDGPGTQVTLTLNQLPYGVTYYLRIRAHDFSGNVGTYSASLSFSFSQAVTADVGNSQITTPLVSASAITIDGLYSNDTQYGLTSTEAEIGTLTVGTDGGTVLVTAKCGTELSDSSGCIFRIRKDSIAGTIIDWVEVKNPLASGFPNLLEVSTVLVGVDASPATSQTYKFTGQKLTGTAQVDTRRLYSLNRKR